jgi:hypothetical protein
VEKEPFFMRGSHEASTGGVQAHNQKQEMGWFSEETGERAEDFNTENEDSAGRSVLPVVVAMLYLSADDRGLMEIPLSR